MARSKSNARAKVENYGDRIWARGADGDGIHGGWITGLVPSFVLLKLIISGT